MYNNAGKSVFAAIIVHAMDNVSVYSLFPDIDHNVPTVTAVITAAVTLIVIMLWGPRTLASLRIGRKKTKGTGGA